MKSYSLHHFIFYRVLLAACFLLVSVTAFAQQTLRTNLYVVGADGSKTLMDGNMTIYDDLYCNCVNWQDAVKFTNPGVNFGLLRSGTTLAVERRQAIPDTDTTYIRMWNLQQKNFAIEVIAQNLVKTDRIGFIKDNYTNLTTPINLGDTTYINFTVNGNTATSASDRFSVIFDKTKPVPKPFKFTDLKVLRKASFVNVVFAVENELLVSNYTVQQAADAVNFKDVKTVAALNPGGSGMYTENAGASNDGDDFYRVKATGTDGTITYSEIVKLPGLGMTVYPNPITSRQLQLQVAVAAEGKYLVTAIGMNGALFPLGNILLSGAPSLQKLSLPVNIKPGVYRIRLAGPGNTVIEKMVTIL